MDRMPKMGLTSCVALIVGACIGSAIFSISGLTICAAGPSAVISWALAAAIFAFYGFQVVELARRYPRSGGIYIFPRRAFGGRKGMVLGFVSGWGYVISNVIAIGFSAICMGTYLSAGFPSLPDGPFIPVVTCLVSAAVIIPGGKVSESLQNAMVLLLVATMAVFCGVAIFGGCFRPENFCGFFTSGTEGGGGVLGAVPLAMVAYGGCVAIAFVASEVSEPRRNIPLSLGLGLGTVALIYVAVVVSLVGTLSPAALQANPSLRMAPLFASVSAGSLSGFPWLSKLISIAASLALLTTVIALTRINARAVEAMSEEGLLPSVLRLRTGRGVAWAAVTAMTAVSVGLCFLSGWTFELISLGAVTNIASMTITCLALFSVRRHKGSSVLLPLLTVAVLWACYVPGVASGRFQMWAYTAAVYLTGAVVYVLCRRGARPRLVGEVVHGKGHGHKHSMPTANLEPYSGEVLPREGVWATVVTVDGVRYGGMTSVGTRPTDDDSPKITVETLLLDFDGDLYGKEMILEFVRYVRPIRKFSDLDALKAQIDEDIRTCGMCSRAR